MAETTRPNLKPGSSVTIGEKYGYAMTIEDPTEATSYFEACVKHTMGRFGKTRAQAEELERVNLGYYAGYYDHATRRRVERLFDCEHPMLGKAGESPTDPAIALLAGAVAATHGVGISRMLATATPKVDG